MAGRRLLLLCCICLNITAFGQFSYTPKFRKLNAEDGLSQSSVTCFLKDRYGFMWIGTRDGLNRYDSYSFRQFKTRSGDSTTLSNNTISVLYEDNSGILWVGTQGGGVNLYDPVKDVFTRFGENTDFNGTIISDITQDRQGDMWIATSDAGLWRYDPATGQSKNISGSVTTSSGDSLTIVVSGVIQTRDGMIWFTTEGSGLVSLNPESLESRVLQSDSSDLDTPHTDFLSGIYEDEENRLWLLSWGYGLSIFDRTTGSFERHVADGEPVSLLNNNIFSIAEDESGKIWLGTRSGLSLYDPNEKSFTGFSDIPGNSYSISDDVVFSLYYDMADSILWVGTWGDGLNILDLQGRNTRHFQHIPDRQNSLSNDNVFGFFEDRDGIIWIGTEGGGLNRYDPETDAFSTYRHDPADPASLSRDDVMCIYQDDSGSMWIGTYGGGLNHFDPSTGRFRVVSYEVDGRDVLNTVLSVMADNTGKIWLTTGLQGIASIDPETEEVNFYSETTGFQEGAFNDVLSILQDRSGIIWVGTRNSGLVRFDPEQNEFRFFSHDPKNPTSLGANGIYALHEDRSGNIWIGTRGAGLSILDPSGADNPEFIKITTAEGLFNDWVLGIVEDASGNIWASGEGISRIDPATLNIQSYFFTSSNQGAFYRSPSTGSFYLGTEGFDIFHPDAVGQNSAGTPVLISNLLRYNSDEQTGTAIPVPGIFTYDSMTFDYTDQILSFEFVNLDFNARGDRKYMYQLENFNSDWIRLGEERKITFTGLPPGDYRLNVRTYQANGDPGKAQATLAFTILPPWWRSAGARIMYALLAVAALFGFYYWRTAEQKRKYRRQEIELQRERELNERLQQVDKLKDQFLANTSHELRTPLQGIIGLSESLRENETDKNKTRDLSMIISSGQRLSSLVNSILDFSKLKTRDLKLNIRPVDLRSAADVVLRINFPMIKGKQVELLNKVPAVLPMVLADEDRLQQVLHNVVGNAVKFTERGSITVRARHESGVVEVEVADTGIGIPANKHEEIFKSFEQLEDSETRQYQGTGLGLSITRQLVELMGGRIWLESDPGKGSVFHFTIPAGSESAGLSGGSETEGLVTMNADTEDELIPHNHGDGQFRVLIVDDEVINQQVLTHFLSEEIYQVDVANDGEHALEKIFSGIAYDLVLLDIMMPRISGYEVCQRIREKFMSSELPVIMITARNQPDDLVKGFNTGANDYISKPFSRGELLSRIRTHLSLSSIHKSNAKFVPAEFLKSIGKESIMDVKLGDQSLHEVTVMFSDIRSYTTISESMSPDENFKFLNRYLSYISPLIRKHHGFINQFLGDGIMAIFTERPEDAVHAAVEMQQAVEKFNREVAAGLGLEIRTGIGLHTGQLMMGILGDQDRMEPSVVSDTVNTASRMEGLTKYFGAPVIVSEITCKDQMDANEFRFLGKVKVKGKSRELRVYEVLAGNPPDIREKKEKAMAEFERGLAHYFKKAFATAGVHFDNALKIYPDDEATKLYLRNSARFLIDGVEKEWSGVEQLEVK